MKRRLFVLALVLAVLPLSVARGKPDPLAAARRAVELRDHDRAETLLAARLEKVPHDVEALKLLVEVYLRTERPELALSAARDAARAAPDDPLARAAVWEAELAVGGYRPAAKKSVGEEVAAWLAASPGDPVRIRAAAAGASLLDDEALKREVRARVLDRMRDDPPEELEGDYLEAVIVSRNADERLGLIRQALELFPHSKQSDYLREIRLWLLRDDRARLLASADSTLAGDPDNRRVRAALARWLLTTDPKEPARAEREITRALALLDAPREEDRPELVSDPEFVRMLRETRGRYLSWLGRARMLEGRAAGALAAFREAAGILPADVDLYLWLGDLESELGHGEAAIDAWARSVASGDSPEAEARMRARLGSPLRDRLRGRLGPAPLFLDATGASGLRGVRGGRIALADVTGDGYPDLLVGGSRLFVNRGDGTFAASTGLPRIAGARGGLFADLDGDGDLDLYVFRTGHPMVLENDGTGRFTDRTPDSMKDRAFHGTEGAAVFDADGDGRLELYEANYERPPVPPLARGTKDRLWHNLGGFRFEDRSDRIRGVSREPMCGRGCATADFDDDGDTDLFVANYRLDPDFLLVNRGVLGLENEARARGVEGECDAGAFGHGIGPAFGDLDGDGHLDLVVGNLAHPRYIGYSDVTRIFRNSGPPDYRFRDVFPSSGVRYAETLSNPSLGDVDLDGDLDLFLTAVYPGRPSFLYLNDGRARFRDVTWLANVRKDNGWGAAFGDVDRDGDLDLVVGSGSGVALYRNAGPTGHYVGLDLVARKGDGGAVGARVTLGGATGAQIREVSGGTGTGCQDDPSIRFGVGAARGPFVLTVRWPDGRLQRIFDVNPGRIYRLVEGGNLETDR